MIKPGKLHVLKHKILFGTSQIYHVIFVPLVRVVTILQYNFHREKITSWIRNEMFGLYQSPISHFHKLFLKMAFCCYCLFCFPPLQGSYTELRNVCVFCLYQRNKKRLISSQNIKKCRKIFQKNACECQKLPSIDIKSLFYSAAVKVLL